MSCLHCDDTGSLSKSLDGALDCPHCEAAPERAALNAWAKRELCSKVDEAELYLIYVRGKAAGMEEVAA
ncbi:hypothetical protein [Massilia sp. TS11]|uniref:hypothetical protein n=1 Tax=Massilia sp. TS11 TaxID=2908003 RepID=UPI001EDAECB5|nr:hypothetical protein [Massilia sp. TS11]MCG2586533.1 hypothetical protein [Massilia sp. TS11]